MIPEKDPEGFAHSPMLSASHFLWSACPEEPVRLWTVQVCPVSATQSRPGPRPWMGHTALASPRAERASSPRGIISDHPKPLLTGERSLQTQVHGPFVSYSLPIFVHFPPLSLPVFCTERALQWSLHCSPYQPLRACV